MEPTYRHLIDQLQRYRSLLTYSDDEHAHEALSALIAKIETDLAATAKPAAAGA